MKKSPYESDPLSEYHLKMNEAAMKAVEEFLKHPYTIEEAKAQAIRLNNQSGIKKEKRKDATK